MPAKAKGRGRRGGRNGGRGCGGRVLPAIVDDEPVAALQNDLVFNGSYVQKKQEASKTILDHPVFNGIDQAEALAIDGQAELSAFSPAFSSYALFAFCDVSIVSAVWCLARAINFSSVVFHCAF